jgi:hypothetical protein
MEPAMTWIQNLQSLPDHILRALNKIRKPSTTDEITGLLNSELELQSRPCRAKEVAEQLRNMEDRVLTLYWLRIRPRLARTFSERTSAIKEVKESPVDMAGREIGSSRLPGRAAWAAL